MAGIEKICEFSGEYGSYDMYRWKDNLIQIMPKFRKKFRNAEHTLYVCKGSMYVESKWGSRTSVVSKQQYKDQNYDRWYDSYDDYIDHRLYGNKRIVTETEYCLVVENKELLGNVQGCYFHQSTNMSKAKRKLKRLLRCKKLNIVEVPENLYEFICNNVREPF